MLTEGCNNWQSDLQGAAAGGVSVGTERGHGYLEEFISTKETCEGRILEVAKC